MDITNAKKMVDKFTGEVSQLEATIDGVEKFVPIDPANRHYAEIIKQVEAGELIIAEADE